MPNPHLLLLNCRLLVVHIRKQFDALKSVSVLTEWLLCFSQFYGCFFFASLIFSFLAGIEREKSEEKKMDVLTRQNAPTYIYLHCPDVCVCVLVLFFHSLIFCHQWIVPLYVRLNLCASLCMCVDVAVRSTSRHYKPYYMCFALIIF